MAIIPVLLGIGQRCPHCGQRSNPRVGCGHWEPAGIWKGSINRCLICQAYLRVGLFFDHLLDDYESKTFLGLKVIHNHFNPAASPIPHQIEERLRQKFLTITQTQTLQMCHPFFIDSCVQPVEQQQVPAMLKYVPGLLEALTQPEDLRNLHLDAGAMIIQGYIAGRVFYDMDYPRHPVNDLPTEKRKEALDNIYKFYSTMKADVPEALANFIISALIQAQLASGVFKKAPKSEKLEFYLWILALNGAVWAKAEKLILG